VYLPKNIIFEGEAEACWFQDKLLIGIGFRSNSDSVEYLKQHLRLDVIELQLIDPYFYHLDTCLFVIDDQTVCYYPPAFSPASQSILQALIPQPIILSEADAQNFA